jgi:hypothetical protein
MAGKIEKLPAAEYHSRPELSHSQAEVFRRDPWRYKEMMAGRVTTRPTEDMIFGSAVHGVLAGEPVHVAIPPDVLDARGARTGNAWKQFALANVGKILLKEHEAQPLEAIEAEVRAHPKAKLALENPRAKRECSILFEYPAEKNSFVPARARLDVLVFADEPLTVPSAIVDWKTTRDASPESFCATAWRLGYHRQAAWYQRAVEEAFGKTVPVFLVAIESEPPHRVELFLVQRELLARANHENNELVREFFLRTVSEDWRPKTWRHTNVLTAPPWAYNMKEE